MARRKSAAIGWIACAALASAACEMESAMKRPERGRAPAPAANPADVASLDAIVGALYASVSFPPGGSPDWTRLRSLFHPGGRLIPPAADEPVQALPVEEFVRLSSRFIRTSELQARGFHEAEVSRRTETFGRIAHVFSVYESRHTPGDREPFSRGINSIQLVFDGGRWWVLTVLWEVEGPDRPIPPPGR